MDQGTQIAYIPSHAKGNVRHPDVEFGFVYRDSGKDTVFCRFWKKGTPGILGTVNCSQGVSRDDLVEYYSVSDGLVRETIYQIEEQDKVDA